MYSICCRHNEVVLYRAKFCVMSFERTLQPRRDENVVGSRRLNRPAFSKFPFGHVCALIRLKPRLQ